MISIFLFLSLICMANSLLHNCLKHGTNIYSNNQNWSNHSNCAWVKTFCKSHIFEAVFHTTGCEYIDGFEIIHFVFLYQSHTWDPSQFHGNAQLHGDGDFSVGLRSQNVNLPTTYSYYRLFAEDTHRKFSGYPDMVNFHNFISGGVKSTWVGNGAFHMSLKLPTNRSFNIYLLNGMKDCTLPLESIDFATLVKWEMDLEKSPQTCESIEKSITPHPLIVLSVNSLVESIETHQFNNYDTWEGIWSENTHKFQQCQLEKSIPERDKRRKYCVIGDSHGIRMDPFFRLILQQYYFKEPNFYHTDNISTILIGEYWHPKNTSIAGSIKNCINNVGINGTVLWFFGSHNPFLSPIQMRKTLSDVESVLKEHHPVKFYITSVPVHPYETVPPYIPPSKNEYNHPLLMYVQNCWKAAAQNHAMSNYLKTQKKTSNSPPIYHIDFFNPSLPLYYHGHFQRDPVHFHDQIYKQFINWFLKYDTINRYCS